MNYVEGAGEMHFTLDRAFRLRHYSCTHTLILYQIYTLTKKSIPLTTDTKESLDMAFAKNLPS